MNKITDQKKDGPAYKDAAYLYGRSMALERLLLAVAPLMAPKPELLHQGMQALQELRDYLLSTPLPDSAMAAVADVEAKVVQSWGYDPAE